jgi:hypothetical protein
MFSGRCKERFVADRVVNGRVTRALKYIEKRDEDRERDVEC